MSTTAHKATGSAPLRDASGVASHAAGRGVREGPTGAGDKLRAPPWYATFAADDLARSDWFGLSASERGLLDSMQRAFWIEHQLPRQPMLLARVVRLDVAEVERNLTAGVLAHFEEVDGVLYSVELHRQLLRVAEIRAKQASGGKVGAAMTNEARRTIRKPKRSKTQHHSASTAASRPAGTFAGPPASLVRVSELQCTALKGTSSLRKDSKPKLTPDQQEWVAESEQAEREATEAAYRAAKG
jgi:hypothetical protein